MVNVRYNVRELKLNIHVQFAKTHNPIQILDQRNLYYYSHIAFKISLTHTIRTGTEIRG